MMSVLKTTLCRSSAVVAALLLLSFPASASEPETSLSCNLASDGYLIGEPVDLEVVLRWDTPEPGVALVTAQSFLVIEVLATDGTPLVTPADWVELRYDLDEEKWCDQPIVLTKESPEWRTKLQLKDRFRFDEPGTYTVVAVWSGPAYPHESLSDCLLEKTPQDHTARPLEKHTDRAETTLVLACPTRETDRLAFEHLTGGKCPTFLSSTTLTQESDRLWELLQRYPSSRYAGYALARWPSVLPGVGDNPLDKVQQLADPEFFARFPKTYDRSNPPPQGQPIDLRQEVQRQAQMRREFLQANPEFPLRESIEAELGNLELALGNFKSAYAALQQVTAKQTDRGDWARGMVAAIETLGLVERPQQ